MQSNPFPFLSSIFCQISLKGDVNEVAGSSRVLFLLSILLSQASDMDLSKVGERILSSVLSARSLGRLPSTPDRPEVPARAAAAAAVARALAGLSSHQRFTLPSSSKELSSIYGTGTVSQVVKELEEDFYKEDFDPVRHVLEHIPIDEDELAYFERQATLRLAQLDDIAEQLSTHVMEHYEEMVKGMHLVRELEKDLKVATVICMNGRRHLTSSMHEVSRDLIVTSDSKKKQSLLELLPILTELCHAQCMQVELESLVEEGNYFKAFQVLSEYLQLLDSFSELSAIQEMSHGVEAWLGKTLQKLDSLLLGVCQEFKEDSYMTVVDAYALIGDTFGLAEKIQSFFLQEVLSETHSVLKNIVQEEQDNDSQTRSLTYSDLCLRIPEPKFRNCLLRTLASLFRIMSAYFAIMDFQVESKKGDLSSCLENVQPNNLSKDDSKTPETDNGSSVEAIERMAGSSGVERSTSGFTLADDTEITEHVDSPVSNVARNNGGEASTSGSPWYQLRKESTIFVSQTLHRCRRNLWQLITSRVSVLLSSSAVCSASIHQFLRNYEDLNVFILAGEAFCGVEAFDFKQKLKVVCENYFAAFHRQNVYALKMVLEKESWLIMAPDTIQVISFAGLIGDGAPLIVSSAHRKSPNSVETGANSSVFSYWLNSGNPFLLKLTCNLKDYHHNSPANGVEPDGGYNEVFHCDKFSPRNSDSNHMNDGSPVPEDEDEDLLADFIDEDSQLPSRISKPRFPRNHFSHCNDEEVASQTGSSLCLLRLMDKYARFMQKLEIVNLEFFKGICQLFEIYFHFLYEKFGHHNIHPAAKGSQELINYRLKATLSRITHDCEQWVKPLLVASSSSSSVPSLNSSLQQHVDVTPVNPPSSSYNHFPGTSIVLKERCAGVDTISLVAQILHRSKPHLQSMLLQNNIAVVEDFYVNVVDAVPVLIEHIHKATARLLLNIDGYVDRIGNAKWEVKEELGYDHNGYVDLLLGEFKHYKTRLVHGSIRQKVVELLIEYGIEVVVETLIEGLSRVKRCSDEGRALMSLDLQVLINGLKHLVTNEVEPKLQAVEAFIKAYYLPETEYEHWARSHPEYSKNQITGLVNLVATTRGWKRKTRLEVLEKI